MTFNLSKRTLLKSFFLIDEFSAVTRYSKNRPIKEENNLEHTGWVCLWSYLIAVDIQNKLGLDLDFGRIMSGAVIHDIDEALTGDIPRPTKYFDKELRDKIAELEFKSVQSLVKRLEHNPHDQNILDDWLESKGIDYPEQFIVKMADLISVVYKVWQEMIMLRNNCFLSVAKEIYPIIEKYVNMDQLENDNIPLELFEYFKFHLTDCLDLLNRCKESTNPIVSIITPLNIVPCEDL